jgi:hypothetical protein
VTIAEGAHLGRLVPAIAAVLLSGLPPAPPSAQGWRAASSTRAEP